MEKSPKKAFTPFGAAQWLDGFRARLAHSEALPQLALLGIVSGLLTGAVAILFRFAIDLPLTLALPGGGSENFESLPLPWRLSLPIAGAVILAAIFSPFKKEARHLGVSNVIERYQLHQAQLPAKNAMLQFIGGAVALVSGQSMGREGPAVHLGASCSSLLGQWLTLPNNSLRTLVGCGIAAAIAASFNTPLAGVIFAMEVVLMEYTVTGFLPVILAAVSGSVLAQLTFGRESAFSIPPLQLVGLLELPWLLVCGIITGGIAAIVLTANRYLLRLRGTSHWLRFSAAGLVTGVVACAVPEVMGLGYDTLQEAMLGTIGFTWLITIVIAKVGVSTLSIALGLPGGGIGPMLVIGACLGGALGMVGIHFAPTQVTSPGFYATVGMGAMMAAALNAPLAALIAILELTHNPHILMPSMLVIVTATLTTRFTTRLPGLFLIGHDPRRYASPVMQMLNRAGVTSIMNTRLAHHSRHLPWHKARSILEERPDWLVIEDIDEPLYLLRPADLAHFLAQQDTATWEPDHSIDLREIPGVRHRLYPIHAGATLQEALMAMKEKNCHCVYISRSSPPLVSDVAGVITREDIDNYYGI